MNPTQPGQSYDLSSVLPKLKGWTGQQYGSQGSATAGELSSALGVSLDDLNKANIHWQGGGWTPEQNIDLSWLTQNMAGRLVAPGAQPAVSTQAQSDAYRTQQIATQEAASEQARQANQTRSADTQGPWIMQNGQQVANPAYKGPAVQPYDPNASMVKPPPIDTTNVVKEVKNPDGTKQVTTTQTQSPQAQPAQSAQQTQSATTQPTGYQGNSIVDYLKSLGEPSDFTSRSQLAGQMGIQNYRGSSSQNIDLLNKLRSKPGGLSSPTTSQTGASQVSPNAGNPAPVVISPPTESVITPYGFSQEVIKAQSSKSPFNAYADAYQALYKDMGLSDIKSQYESMTKQYKDLEDKKADEIADINEDPWLTEGVRTKRVQGVENRYESKTANMTNQMKQLETLFSKGVEEVKFIAGQAMQASHQQDVLSQQWAMHAEDLAQKQAQAQNKYDPGMIGEYQFARDQGYKGSFSQYQNEDANRKISVAKAGVNQGGLTPAQINNTVNSIAGAFDNEPTVKEYNTIKRNLDTYNNLGNSATDDIQRVYTFAKVADPNSAVKEGEYASIEKYAQAVMQRAGLKVQRVFSATGILTPEARSAMGKTLQTSLDASERAYKNVEREYQRQVNDAYAGKPRQITSYSGSPSQTAQQGGQYDNVIAKTPTGQIPVLQKSSGTPGYISLSEFDPSKYTPLNMSPYTPK